MIIRGHFHTGTAGQSRGVDEGGGQGPKVLGTSLARTLQEATGGGSTAYGQAC